MKKVKVIRPDGSEVTHESIKEAEKAIGVKYGSIKEQLRTKGEAVKKVVYKIKEVEEMCKLNVKLKFSKIEEKVADDILSQAKEQSVSLTNEISENILYELNAAAKRLKMDIDVVRRIVKAICNSFFSASCTGEIRIGKEEWLPTDTEGHFTNYLFLGETYTFIDGEEEPSRDIIHLKTFSPSELIEGLM